MRPWALPLLLGALRLGAAPARNALLLLGELGPPRTSPSRSSPRPRSAPGPRAPAPAHPEPLPRSGRRRLRERRLQQLCHPHARPGRAGSPQPPLPKRLHRRQQLLPQPGQHPHWAAPGGRTPAAPLPTPTPDPLPEPQPRSGHGWVLRGWHRPALWSSPVCSTRMGCTGCTRTCTTSTPSMACGACPSCSARQTSARVRSPWDGEMGRETSPPCPSARRARGQPVGYTAPAGPLPLLGAAGRVLLAHRVAASPQG